MLELSTNPFSLTLFGFVGKADSKTFYRTEVEAKDIIVGVPQRLQGLMEIQQYHRDSDNSIYTRLNMIKIRSHSWMFHQKNENTKEQRALCKRLQFLRKRLSKGKNLKNTPPYLKVFH